MTGTFATTGRYVAWTESRRWAFVTLTVAGAALVLLFAVVPHTVLGDGYIRFLKVDALLRHGTIRGERYSYIGPLFAAPLWVFGDARLWWCARFNVLVLGIAGAAIWRLLRTALPRGERAAAVLLLISTGMLPHATRDFYAELLSAVLVGTGLLVVTISDRRWGWIPIVLGVANIPAWISGLVLVMVWRVWQSRRVDALLAAVAAISLVLLENTIVRGAPLAAGYAGDRGAITVMPYSGMPGFSYPFIFGLVSLLFSFGKGLLFFAPGLLLVPQARRDSPRLAPFLDLSLVFLAGLLLVYSQWWAWYGGWVWGPRFLLFAAYPSAVALAVALGRTASPARAVAVLAIACWTTWVGVSGVVFGLAGLDVCTASGYALEHLCWYVPDFSPLFRPLVLLPAPLALWQQVWMLFAALVLALLVTSGPVLPNIAGAIRAAVWVPRVRREQR